MSYYNNVQLTTYEMKQKYGLQVKGGAKLGIY